MSQAASSAQSGDVVYGDKGEGAGNTLLLVIGGLIIMALVFALSKKR